MAPDGNPDNEHALAALLDYIARERDRRRDRILGAAREEAEATVREARRQARQRVRDEVERARRDRRSRLQAARAAADSRLRRRRYEIVRARLDEAWGRLERCLGERWADPDARREWVAATLETAARHLPAGTWTLEHAGSGDDLGAAGEAFTALQERRPDVDVERAADADMTAGLRIVVANAVLDTSAAALLGRRAHVEGLLLGALGAEVDASSDPAVAGEAS